MPLDTPGKDTKVNGNNHDDDVMKSRTRVSRACTRCRTRKDRCDGLRPSCTACTNAQQICCYEPSTKKRGLPEGYVRGLEKLLALLIGRIEGFEDTTSILLKNNRQQLSKIWNHAVIGEELHSTWKESQIVTELESLLSSLDQNHTAGHKRKRDRDEEAVADESDADSTFHITAEYRITPLKPNADALRNDSSLLSQLPALPQQALHLLDQYFAHTNCWFPILRRPDLTRACYEMARSQATPVSKATAPLLWAVFAYASRQIRASDALQNIEHSSEAMRDISFRLLPNDIEDYSIVHAQCLLVLSLIDMGSDHWISAWVSIGKAIRVVLAHAARTKEQDKITMATLQGCAILDIACAAHMNCIPHLRKQDFESMPKLAEDGHEEWEPWNGADGFRGQREPSFSISTFNRLTDVYLTIGAVIIMQRRLQKPDQLQVQALLASLHELQATFPGQMPPSTHSPPHQIYLQLCHVSAQMRLVELPVEAGIRSHERAKLACNVLSLLALCKNSPAIGLMHLPPFCFDAIESARRLAHQSKEFFGSVTNLPSFEDFRQTSMEYIGELSSVWPLYQRLSEEKEPAISRAKRHSRLHDTPDDTVMVSDDIMGNHLFRVPTQSSVTGLSDSRLQGIDSAIPHSALADSWVSNGARIGSYTSPAAHNIMPLVPAHLSLGDNFVDSTMGAGLNDHHLVDASPSFHGDEIDAIFREMAHLDTNEWTTERATDLKDFGFDDDLTFQAFCNDPDRLADSDLNGHTLSSSLQTWTFTTDPG